MLTKIKEFSSDPTKACYYLYLFFLYCKKYYIFGPFIFFINVFYSYVLSIRLFGVSSKPKVVFTNGLFRVKLVKSRSSVCKIDNGVLIFEKWRSGCATLITISKYSKLTFANTFSIGDNCKISLFENAELSISGRSEIQMSGITADTIILCSKKVSIGCGVIISWNCYISDSTQHEFNNLVRTEEVTIGNHVWISEGVNCGPGSNIGDGSVVGAKSYLVGNYPENSLIVGIPAAVKKSGITWKR